jgi:radical SAM protein with 4Fe4S-binding SPASM domain
MNSVVTSDAPRKPYMRSTLCVWELTLKCNLACGHCGSRAGDARADEMSTAEALETVRQLKEVGIDEVVIEGGEAFLRKDWLQIARAIVDHGMKCGMVTGGYGVSAETARRMRDAGIGYVAISLDGLEDVHDQLRGKKGSFASVFATMEHFRNAGVRFGCNTQINRLSAPQMPALYELIKSSGATGWQFMLTAPMGNAADRAEILLQPCELLDLFPMLDRIVRRAEAEGIRVHPGNNIGYFGPYKSLQGESETSQLWMGCQAGLTSIGIEADGSVKACPSLPTLPYTGGNVRKTPLRDIMQSREIGFNTSAGTDEGTAHLWGFCKTCEFAEICRGGCTFTAHSLLRKRGNNPYCHHRTIELRKRGTREVVTQKLAALGKPFDYGLFEILEQPSDAPWPAGDPLRFTAEKVAWPAGFDAYPFR